MHTQTISPAVGRTKGVAPSSSTETADVFREIYARDATDERVAVVDGHGVCVSVKNGHLVLSDGVGPYARSRTYSRAGRKLQRVVILSRDGSVTVDALRWCSDVGVTLTAIDPHTATMLATTGAADTYDDARLRRAQALATTNGTDLEVVRYLLTVKVERQLEVLRDHFAHSRATISRIADHVDELATARSVDTCRELEARAARIYFNAWTGLGVNFARRDAAKVPAHWRSYETRNKATVSGRSNMAINPINAMLNYGYALAESECVTACHALGLDPGMGMLHKDRRDRNSLALDILECVRPSVDRYVLRVVSEQVFRLADFHETRDGQCRLLAPLTHYLAEASHGWARDVAPIAETVAHMLIDSVSAPIPKRTPLSESRRKAAMRDISKRSASEVDGPALPERTCVECGSPTGEKYRRRKYCPDHSPKNPKRNAA